VLLFVICEQVMSVGLYIQRARLLSDVLEDVASRTRSDKNIPFSYLDPKFNFDAQPEPRIFNSVSKRTRTFDFSTTSFGLTSSEDPDTESDENGSPSSVTSLSSSDDENVSDPATVRGSNKKEDDDDFLFRAPIDEKSCTKLLQNKINAVLDSIERDSASAEATLKGCANLPSDLKFDLLVRSIARKSVTDASLKCFLTICSKLDSDDCKEHGTDSAKDLRQLSLCECQNITDAGLQTIARCCPQLQALDLTGCRSISALGLQSIVRCCRQLTELCVSGCPAFCDKTIPTIFKYNVPSHIRFLSLRRCDIHDHGLSELASYCPSLQKLDVRSCGLLTASGFRALIQRVPTICMLSCGHCVGMDDASLRYLAQGYGSSLTDINLDMCWRVSSRGVAELAQHCKHLRSMNLSSCTSVDDSALKAIIRNPYLRKTLQFVNLNECNVGDDALEELIVNCSSLTYISVVGCPRVTYQRAVRIAQLAGVQIVM